MKKSEKSAISAEFQTPMMQQYLELKEQYPDCILFFRLGDFYEMFLEDAKVGAHILGITLTRRSRGKDGAIPMAGVPYHAVDLYLPRLVNAGHKVAIAEQVSSPKDTPHLVAREVVRIVTAGTMIEGRTVSEKESAFVSAIVFEKKYVHISFADIATGEFYVCTTSKENVSDFLHRYSPKEIILAPNDYNSPAKLQRIKAAYDTNLSVFHDWEQWSCRAEHVLQTQLRVSSLRAFGVESSGQASSAAALFGYLSYTQHNQVAHLRSLQMVTEDHFLQLDATTIESLELFLSNMDRSREGSLLQAIDHTRTALGSRLLKRWLSHPLCDKNHIQSRLDDVHFFVSQPLLLSEVEQVLSEITDLERQLSKLAVNIGTARDLTGIKTNCDLIDQLLQLPGLEKFSSLFSALPEVRQHVTQHIETWIENDPPGTTKIGGMIKPGNHPELDALRDTHQAAFAWVTSFEAQERARTGIGNLKVGFNNVFGFYIEISKSQAKAVNEDFGYHRKQTLVNAERFITDELKGQEEKVLTAKDSADELEYDLFQKNVEHILEYSNQLQSLAQAVAHLDCVAGFARVALEERYVRPQLNTEHDLQITNGRHPVVERYLRDQFVPNSTDMQQEKRMALITGPNMAGKSTYIRQVALIVLLAHIGSYVPAEQANIPICNRIFSRIGASDALHKGLSTFMVEMTETARILHHTTDRSLIIFDEIGRGTGVHDGLAIAQAIAEYVAVMPQQPLVFFATHYHELSALSTLFPQIKNYSMAVQLRTGKMIFLRTLQSGSSHHSYGVEVAKEAGLPVSILKRAEALRDELHAHQPVAVSSLKKTKKVREHPVVSQLHTLNLNEITPKQAQEVLWSLKEQL